MLRFTDNLIAEMTLACNRNCAYCYEHSHGKNIADKTPMTFESFKKALDTYLYYRCILGKKENKVIWHFHGGEVFMIPWEELKKMIMYLEERQAFFPGLDYIFQTNGYLVNEEIARFLESRGKVLGFSFDSYADDFRGTAEENQKLMNHIRDLHTKTRVKCCYLMVLSKKNMKTWIEDWNKSKDFCDTLGINALSDVTDEYIMTPEEIWEYWYKPVLESFLKKEGKIRERTVEIMFYIAVANMLFNIKTSEDKVGCFSRVCGHGSNMIMLTSDGSLYPCDKYLEGGDYISLRYKSSIDEPDFLGINNVKYVYNFCKNMFNIERGLECDSCGANDFCLGECQSTNLSKYGKFKISEETCYPYKKLYDFVKENIRDLLLNNEIPIGDLKVFEGINRLSDFGKEILNQNKDLEITIDNMLIKTKLKECK